MLPIFTGTANSARSLISFGESMPAATAILTERDLRILRHVHRYRLSTTEAIRKVFDLTDDAETAITRRLVKNGFLRQGHLFLNRKFFHLTPQSGRVLGLDEKAGTPPGPQAITNSFAVLAFCCLGPVLRERITRLEFLRDYRQFVVKGVASDHYYWDTDKKGTRRFAFMRADHGGEAKRVVHRAVIETQKRATNPAFQELLNRPESGFMISILTTNEDKAAAIRKYIKQSGSIAAFRVEVIPGLDLLTLPLSKRVETLQTI